jgi:hypothetical protein
VICRASSASATAAITITREAPSRSTSARTVGAASPEAKHTLWGRVSCSNRVNDLLAESASWPSGARDVPVIGMS